MQKKIKKINDECWHVWLTKERPVFIRADDVRSVWAALSVEPTARIPKLAEKTYMNKHKVRACMEFLIQSGYIEYYSRPTVIVKVPFVEEDVY